MVVYAGNLSDLYSLSHLKNRKKLKKKKRKETQDLVAKELSYGINAKK